MGRGMKNCERRALALALICFAVLVPGVSAKRRVHSHTRGKQTADQEMRLKKLDCERNTCSHLDGESRLNCNYKCISEPCYQEIYGQDEVRKTPRLPRSLCKAPSQQRRSL